MAHAVPPLGASGFDMRSLQGGWNAAELKEVSYGDHRVALQSDHSRTLSGTWYFSIVCDLELVI